MIHSLRADRSLPITHTPSIHRIMSGTVTQSPQQAGEWQASTVKELRRLNDEYLHQQIAAICGSANPEERLLTINGQYAESLGRMIPLPASEACITPPTSNERGPPEDVEWPTEEIQRLYWFSSSGEAVTTYGSGGVLRVTNADEEKTPSATFLGRKEEAEEDEESDDDDGEDDKCLRGRLHMPRTSVSEYLNRHSLHSQTTHVQRAHRPIFGRSVAARVLEIFHVRRPDANDDVTGNRAHRPWMAIRPRNFWSR